MSLAIIGFRDSGIQSVGFFQESIFVGSGAGWRYILLFRDYSGIQSVGFQASVFLESGAGWRLLFRDWGFHYRRVQGFGVLGYDRGYDRSLRNAS